MQIFKRVLLSLLGLALVIALWVYVEAWRSAYSNYEKDTRGYMGLQIGASRDEAMYVFGYPQFVLGPEGQGVPKTFMRVYQVDGKDPINAMPVGTTINSFYEWMTRRDGHQINVAFDPTTKLVTGITCMVDKSQGDISCPPIFGIMPGLSEDQVVERLGRNDFVKHDGVSKGLRYDALGLNVTLTERTVYMIEKRAPKGIAWRWIIWHVWL